MSWGSSIFLGILTAIVGALASGLVASRATDWYNISGFEAGAAAFLFGFVFLGLIGGFTIGVTASRVMGAGVNPGFLKVLGASNGILLGLVAVVGVSARLLADVPPTIDGEELILAVEFRWPEGHATSPASLPGDPAIRLGTLTRGRVMRKSSRGPLWTADARLVDGRWVVPGAVEIFTTRGKLMLAAELDEKTTHGFLIPLSGSPSKKDFEWTEWYPQTRPGVTPPNGFTYRYRVQPRSQPVRTDTVGPFTVSTIAYYFYDEQIDSASRIAVRSEFTLTHRGNLVAFVGRTSPEHSETTRLSKADGVAAIAAADSAAQPALLVHFADEETGGACYLLTDRGGQLQTDFVPKCPSTFEARPLTSDSAEFRTGVKRLTPSGWLDHTTFATPGLYLVARTVLDTRRLAVRSFDVPSNVSEIPSVPPLGLSPDERSVVRFTYDDHSDSKPVIVVTDVVVNESYLLPIDPARMRYADIDVLDPAWLAHHFRWERNAEGIDRLVERKDFVPIPYHGKLVVERDFRAYWFEPAREELRDAIIELLVRDMGGERVPVDSFAHEHPVKVNGQNVNVAYGSSGQYVSVTLDRGVADITLLREVGRRIDAELATGKYDALFGK